MKSIFAMGLLFLSVAAQSQSYVVQRLPLAFLNLVPHQKTITFKKRLLIDPYKKSIQLSNGCKIIVKESKSKRVIERGRSFPVNLADAKNSSKREVTLDLSTIQGQSKRKLLIQVKSRQGLVPTAADLKFERCNRFFELKLAEDVTGHIMSDERLIFIDRENFGLSINGGKPHRGTFESFYRGFFSDFLFHGKGELYLFSGEAYRGSWNQGLKHGDFLYLNQDGQQTEQYYEYGELIPLSF